MTVTDEGTGWSFVAGVLLCTAVCFASHSPCCTWRLALGTVRGLFCVSSYCSMFTSHLLLDTSVFPLLFFLSFSSHSSSHLITFFTSVTLDTVVSCS